MEVSIQLINSIPYRGLICSMDIFDIDSYAGPGGPIGLQAPYNELGYYLENVVYSTNVNITFSNSGFYISTNEYVPGLKDIFNKNNGTVYAAEGYNNYPNSGQCCPTIFDYLGGPGNLGSPTYLTVSPSTQYTFSIVFKTSSGYTHPNFMYRYEYYAANTTLTAQGGTYSDANRQYLGNGWWWAWSTFTTNANTARIRLWFHTYEYSTTVKGYYLAHCLFAKGDWRSLPPKYWYPPAGTWNDLPGTYATDETWKNKVRESATPATYASSLSYYANGRPHFNGTNNYVLINNTKPVNSGAFWIRPLNPASGAIQVIYGPNSNGQDNWVSIDGTTGKFYLLITEKADVNNYGLLGTTVMTAGVWYHVAFTMTSRQAKVFVNGVEENSVSPAWSIGAWVGGSTLDATSGYSFTAALGRRGAVSQYYYKGEIGSVQLYEQTLTPNEILQHYNATKGKFGY